MTDTTDLDTLAAAGTTVEVGGARLVISPIRVRELPAFARAVEPMATDLAEGADLMALIARHADHVLDAVAIGARVDRDWLDSLAVDDLVPLAAAVLEVNADFFVRRVLPGVLAAAERINAQLAGSSSTPASGARG